MDLFPDERQNRALKCTADDNRCAKIEKHGFYAKHLLYLKRIRGKRIRERDGFELSKWIGFEWII